ncbi:MAG: Carboxypeptidase precursor [Pseudomonadota bacterium]
MNGTPLPLSRFFSLQNIILTAVAFGIPVTLTNAAFSEAEKQIYSVELAQEPNQRAYQLETLSNFDFLGISERENIAEVALPPSSLTILDVLGLTYKNSHLNQQLNTEALDEYLSPEEVRNELSQLAQSYPDLTELRTIGRSRRDQPIQALVISAAPNNKNQPTLLFNAMHHAREVMTTEVVVHMAQVLLSRYGQNAEITEWLNTARIIVVPQVNPDGNNLVHTGRALWRKNAWEDNGRLYGVDLNRNYPALWGACNGSSIVKSSDSYRGPNPKSEPETQAMVELVTSERPVANISYHSFSEMILYPYGCRREKNPSLDLFKSLAASMKEALIDDSGRTNTYSLGTPPELLYEADGTDADWQFREAGVISFAYEVNSRRLGFQPSYKQWRDVTVGRQEGGWQTLIRETLSQGVKAQLKGFRPDEIHYRINQLKNGEKLEFSANDPSVLPFKPRSAEGFLFNSLLPGSYEMTMSRNDQELQAIQFTVQPGEVTNLGVIEI